MVPMEPRPLTVSPGVRLVLALARPVRAGARWVRHAPDRLLHPVRRWRARRRVTRLRPRVVLVVCHGNICRSPYAARRLQSVLPVRDHDQVTVGSAGFLAAGHFSPARAVAAAEALGIDLSTHRSQQLTGELLRDADLVLVMEATQQQAITSVHRSRAATTLMLGDFDPEPIATRAIADPYGRSLEEFAECYRRLDRCVAMLAATLDAARSITDSAGRRPYAAGTREAAGAVDASRGAPNAVAAAAPTARA
jgi:low molecular weight protein-tyrosine phosphatase